MKGRSVHIRAIGLVTPLGSGPGATLASLAANRSALAPLSLFPLCQHDPLPVGQVDMPVTDSFLPRTHQLALAAARQALSGQEPPDAIVLGTTTGGMLTSEPLLRKGVRDPARYQYHGLHTVTRLLSRELECRGPLLTVSTACSSGALALALGMAMIRQGRARRVLAGGVDSLCRLTYFGFHSLQLVDPDGSRPLDMNRRGMSVAEGAAFLLLTDEQEGSLAELAGAGLSCDAHHPAAPHPEGRGAGEAMAAALMDAEIAPAEVDYINLHGTGTVENDAAECAALHRIFPNLPQLSSIKGATGHSLAAAGAIEAAVAVLCLKHGLLPANTNLNIPDPSLEVRPLTRPRLHVSGLKSILSNSFGFGGNNVSLVIGRAGPGRACSPLPSAGPLYVHGVAVLSGAGGLDATLERFCRGMSCADRLESRHFEQRLNGKTIRRLQRLPRMALALAAELTSEQEARPGAVFLATAWGALSETHAFLTRLFASDERFPGPIDFVGSVHNGPAGQVALAHGSRGGNVTVSGGNTSFEQALFCAELCLERTGFAFLIGVDEAHELLSPLFDPSCLSEQPADGGGGLLISRQSKGALCALRLVQPAVAAGNASVDQAAALVAAGEAAGQRTRLILASLPVSGQARGKASLERFLRRAGLGAPVIFSRDLLGQFGSASALAASIGAALAAGQSVSGADCPVPRRPGERILLLGLGEMFSVVEFVRL